jgi:Protein of unknown function (DUF2839)
MGEAKRRKETLNPGGSQEKQILPGLPISGSQAERFVQLSTKGAWIGIGLLLTGWVTIRWIGPALGWWHVVDG